MVGSHSGTKALARAQGDALRTPMQIKLSTENSLHGRSRARGVTNVKIGRQGGDLDVVERAALGGGEGGHQRAGFAAGDRGAPVFLARGDGQLMEVRHHAGARIGFVADGTDGVKQYVRAKYPKSSRA